MVTLKDIARKAGVDASTVSKVLQGAPIRISSARREEILAIAKELDYKPNLMARGLRLRRGNALAFVVPSTTNYLYPEIVDGAEQAAEELGFALFLIKSTNPHPRLLPVVGHGRIDALIFTNDQPSEEVARELSALEVPWVCLNRTKTDDCGFVALDDEAGFALQADHLLSLGHRNIVFVRIVPKTFLTEMCTGFFAARIQEKGAALLPSHVLECGFGGEQAEEVAERICNISPRPTAVAAASVPIASRLVESLRSRGVRVPEDISVIGYHDSPAALWPPPGVSTVKMPSRAQGYLSVRRVVELLNGVSFDGEIVEESPVVIERSSCGPVPSKK